METFCILDFINLPDRGTWVIAAGRGCICLHGASQREPGEWGQRRNSLRMDWSERRNWGKSQYQHIPLRFVRIAGRTDGI